MAHVLRLLQRDESRLGLVDVFALRERRGQRRLPEQTHTSYHSDMLAVSIAHMPQLMPPVVSIHAHTRARVARTDVRESSVRIVVDGQQRDAPQSGRASDLVQVDVRG